MPSAKGFFSLVQFVPDLDRREAVNVGVVLAVPSEAFLAVRMADDNEGPKQRFGNIFDEARLGAAKRAIEGRIREEGISWTGPDDVVRFAAREGNNLLLTPPRTLLSARPEAELEELFQKLVHVDPRARRRQARPELEVRFERALAGVPLRKNVHVEIPNLGTMDIPYAYKNGVLNLVRPEGFAIDEGSAMRKASELAVKGRLIHKHPEVVGECARLIVVGGFAGAASDVLKSRIAFVLSEHDTRLVREEDLDGFVDEVRAEAHG